MAGKDNISDLGKSTRFSSTNQPQRNGRKPSTYALIKKLFGTEANAELSKEDYYKLIAYLLERPIDDLQKLAKDKSAPIWIVTIIRAIIKDAGKGNMFTIDSLFDRLFGKATQSTNNKSETTVELKGGIPIRQWVMDRLQRKND